jgi:hypothetical protein
VVPVRGLDSAVRHWLWPTCCLATWLSVSMQTPPVYASPALRVRARVRLELHAAYSDGTVRLSGLIRDDLDVPLSQRDIRVQLQPLPATSPSQARQLRSDGAGHFAATFSLTAITCQVLLAFEGDDYYERSDLTQQLDAVRSPVELRFDQPQGREIDLDKPSVRVALRASADVAVRDLTIDLTDELGRSVATGRTDETGGLAIDVPCGRLGEPGLGELSAENAGSETRAPIKVTKPVLRTRTTQSALVARWDRAGQRLDLQVRLTTTQGPLANKTVGVFVDGTHLVTLTTDARGEASHRVLPTPLLAQGSHELIARFASGDIGLRSSESTRVALDVLAPETPSALWLLLPALVSLAWALWSARRARRAEVPQALIANGLPPLQFGASQRGNPAIHTLDGAVLDADLGTPIVARLHFVAGDRTTFEQPTSLDGRFRSPVLRADLYRVLASAPGYAPTQFELRVPHTGTGSGIRVALRSLRIAALDAHAPIARRVIGSEARLQVATVRETLRAAVGGKRSSQALTRLTLLVEQTVYARPAPTPRDLEQIQQAAGAAIADLDASGRVSSDPSLES